MEKIITKFKKNEGYISIETIIVSGLIICLGGISIGNLGITAENISGKSISSISNVQNQFN